MLRRTGRVGLGRVVVSRKQHLAVVAPQDEGLLVALLRWAEEVRDMKGLPLPGDAEAMGLTAREMKMGEQLVLDMAEPWSPERFRDEFTEKVEALVEAKRKTGAMTRVVELMPGEVTPGADIIDLTELLRQSLRSKARRAHFAAALKEADHLRFSKETGARKRAWIARGCSGTLPRGSATLRRCLRAQPRPGCRSMSTRKPACAQRWSTRFG